MKQLYDIQGVPLKVGSLVACLENGYWANGLHKTRVTDLGVGLVHLPGGKRALPYQCVVLEEPVWPNS